MQVALFQPDEVLLARDLQQGFQGINQSFQTFINTTDFPQDTLLVGGQVSATSPASSCVQLGSLIGVQQGQLLNVPAPIQINILGSSCAYGSGQAAGSSPRIDVVCIQYTTEATNNAVREFINPTTQVQTSDTISTTQVDGFAIQVVHGTPSSTPVAPAIPSGWWGLAQVYVPANASTITSSDITDISSTYRTDGGHLALTSQGLLQWVNATTVQMPSGSTFQVGATAFTDQNGTLAITSGTEIVTAMPVQLTNVGPQLTLQPQTAPTSPIPLMEIKTAGGTSLATIDSEGNALVTQATATDLVVTGLTGATAGMRLVGATVSGTPTTGTFAVGDTVVDQTGNLWVCTASGTPGTWTNSGMYLLGLANTWQQPQTFPGPIVIEPFYNNTAGWINLPTTGPSGIGSGGAGTNAWVGYVAKAGNWLADSAVGDIAYRNTSGRLLWGTSSGDSQMQLDSAGLHLSVLNLTAASAPATGAGQLSQVNNQLWIGNGTSGVPVGSSPLTAPLTYAALI